MSLVKFQIYSIDASGGEDCSNPLLAFDSTTPGIKLTVNGVVVVDYPEFGFSLPAIPIIVNAPTNTISVDNFVSTGVSGEIFQFEIIGLNPWESIDIELELVRGGYHSYQNIFQVFGLDFDPYIVIVDTIRTTPFYAYYGFYTPFVNSSLTYYLVSSYPAFSTYFEQNGVTSVIPNKKGIISYADPLLAANVITFDVNGLSCIEGPNDLILKTIPSGILQVTNTGCSNEDCISIFSNNYAVLALDFTYIQKYPNNGTLEYCFTDFEIEFSLIDYNGTVIATQINSITGISYPYVHNAASYPFYFNIPETGDYIIQACLVIRNPNDSTQILHKCCTFEKVQGCNWWSIKKTDNCNEYTICNKSFQPTTITYASLNSDNVFEDVGELTIEPCECVTVTIDSTNVFKFTGVSIDKNGGEPIENSTIMFNDCKIKDCFNYYIKTIACGGGKDCHDCNDCNHKDYYNFVALQALLFTYMNIVNSIYSFNYLYDVLPVDLNNNLFTAKDLMSKALEFCEECDTPCKDCG
jgi:hypothetical protein